MQQLTQEYQQAQAQTQTQNQAQTQTQNQSQTQTQTQSQTQPQAQNQTQNQTQPTQNLAQQAQDCNSKSFNNFFGNKNAFLKKKINGLIFNEISGRGITPSQLLAHLQQLDPAIAAAATPSQLQLLQQKHQQLWTLQQQVR